MLTKTLTIPIQKIQHPIFIKNKLILEVLRTDKTDPVISGNKWFKLKYNLIEAKEQGYTTLMSFGGPYSNHLHALATAGKANGFNTIGIIRGEEHLPLNPTLSDVTQQGMKLYYINRKMYRNKHTPQVLEQLKQMITKARPFSNSEPYYLVPEGGTNATAIKGAAEIASFIPDNTDFICVPCGTGGTAAGIISGVSSLNSSENSQKKTILGFPAMKGGEFLEQTIHSYLSNDLSPLTSWQLLYDWHFGGFGKINKTLALFIEDFEQKYSIDLDPIYTAKMMYAIVSMAKNDYFPEGSKIVVIHTGGLQGKRGMKQKMINLCSS